MGRNKNRKKFHRLDLEDDSDELLSSTRSGRRFHFSPPRFEEPAMIISAPQNQNLNDNLNGSGSLASIDTSDSAVPSVIAIRSGRHLSPAGEAPFRSSSLDSPMPQSLILSHPSFATPTESSVLLLKTNCNPALLPIVNNDLVVPPPHGNVSIPISNNSVELSPCAFPPLSTSPVTIANGSIPLSGNVTNANGSRNAPYSNLLIDLRLMSSNLPLSGVANAAASSGSEVQQVRAPGVLPLNCLLMGSSSTLPSVLATSTQPTTGVPDGPVPNVGLLPRASSLQGLPPLGNLMLGDPLTPSVGIPVGRNGLQHSLNIFGDNNLTANTVGTYAGSVKPTSSGPLDKGAGTHAGTVKPTSSGSMDIGVTIEANKDKPWTSLFNKLPRNAGTYTPKSFVTVEDDGIMVPPPEVIEAGHLFWKDYIVGFFLDANPPYDLVRSHCRRVWNLKGGLRVHYDNSMFYFYFNNPEERQRILESPPTFIQGKPFIITLWCPSVDTAREQVLSIPVWAHFSNIPSVLQPLEGIDWLASLVGELKCFDANTVDRKRLVFAKALIEIKPDKPLPSKLKVHPAKGQVAVVDVRYSWKPDICITCHSFGQTTEFCKHGITTLPTDSNPIPVLPKVPLPRPPKMQWLPKPPQAIPPPIFDTPPPTSDKPCDPVIFSSSDPAISWNAVERTWVHHVSQMRYNPSNGTYFKFISETVDDDRHLFYLPVGDGLALAASGPLGDWNKLLLEDPSWDRDFVYATDYDPKLARSFSGFLLVVGPPASDQGYETSHDE